MTRDELYKEATRLNIPGRGSMTKNELEAAIKKCAGTPFLDYEGLRKRAAELKIPNRSKMSKEELQDAVQQAEQAPTQTLTDPAPGTIVEVVPLFKHNRLWGFCTPAVYPALATELRGCKRSLNELIGKAVGEASLLCLAQLMDKPPKGAVILSPSEPEGSHWQAYLEKGGRPQAEPVPLRAIVIAAQHFWETLDQAEDAAGPGAKSNRVDKAGAKRIDNLRKQSQVLPVDAK